MAGPVVFANELTCLEPLSSILPRDFAGRSQELEPDYVSQVSNL
jgi:hypothetical protein